MVSVPRPRVDSDMDQNTENLQQNHFSAMNYEEFARIRGEEAYRNAKKAELPEEIARRFREVFGTPVEQEFRPE